MLDICESTISLLYATVCTIDRLIHSRYKNAWQYVCNEFLVHKNSSCKIIIIL